MNSESRLSEPAPQPAIEEVTAIAVDGGVVEEKEAGNGKGFFGRVLSALTGSETVTDEDHPDRHVVGTPGLVNLRRMRVDDVAIPKVEIVAAPANLSLEDLVEMFREHGFSRMPVFRGTLDSPLGLIHLKDLALKHGFNSCLRSYVC